MVSDAARPHRVAVYFAPPPQSRWGRAGSEWLGRCALSDQTVDQSRIDGIAPDHFARLTAEPRRYGWHATLKAPFQLSPELTLDSLRLAMRRLCVGREPFNLPPLQVSCMGHFLALRTMQRQSALDQLAADCVQQLQPLAQPLSEAELARRRRSGLTPGQDALLQAWGYPYVLDEYRFHFSLTGPLPGVPADVLVALLEAASARFHLLPALRVDRLSLFVEPEPGAAFRLVEQFEFQS
ncbi:MAG: DUF1045 domain-containing protein [Burkholderiaceae bacterium]